MSVNESLVSERYAIYVIADGPHPQQRGREDAIEIQTTPERDTSELEQLIRIVLAQFDEIRLGALRVSVRVAVFGEAPQAETVNLVARALAKLGLPMRVIPMAVEGPHGCAIIVPGQHVALYGQCDVSMSDVQRYRHDIAHSLTI